jgi:hypothetical protein
MQYGTYNKKYQNAVFDYVVNQRVLHKKKKM